MKSIKARESLDQFQMNYEWVSFLSRDTTDEEFKRLKEKEYVRQRIECEHHRLNGLPRRQCNFNLFKLYKLSNSQIVNLLNSKGLTLEWKDVSRLEQALDKYRTNGFVFNFLFGDLYYKATVFITDPSLYYGSKVNA